MPRLPSINDEVLRCMTQFYLDSRDFNGIPLLRIVEELAVDKPQLKDTLANLINEGEISLNFGDLHPNPHIKAFPEEPSETQIEKLKNSELGTICAYPSGVRLKQVVDETQYNGRPFTARLALGEPQLAFEVFDPSVLEFYRNDPRYLYDNNEIWGHISYTDVPSAGLPSSDQVVLQSFGFAYDSELNRAVAVFLTYLSDLSPEHQQIWNAKIVGGDYKLHPDYFDTSLLGQWADHISIFDAFGEELHHVNEMCKLMVGRPLFKNEFRGRDKPRGFGFLIRPTLKEFNEFIHLLDKAIAENINRDFFSDAVAIETEQVRRDGKVVVTRKGTIRLLEEWIESKWKLPDPEPFKDMIATFKRIRKLRQHPAHAIDEDIFDQRYFEDQRELMREAYEGIRLLRLLFANHRAVVEYEVPDVLYSGRIRTV